MPATATTTSTSTSREQQHQKNDVNRETKTPDNRTHDRYATVPNGTVVDSVAPQETPHGERYNSLPNPCASFPVTSSHDCMLQFAQCLATRSLACAGLPRSCPESEPRTYRKVLSARDFSRKPNCFPVSENAERNWNCSGSEITSTVSRENRLPNETSQ
jgi:hypothetical protein